VQPEQNVAVTQIIRFAANPMGTLVDDQLAIAFASLAPHLQGIKRLGSDSVFFALLNQFVPQDIRPILNAQRRTKLPDEIALIQRGVNACQAAYALARKIIQPNLSEWDLYLQLEAAAAASVGEPIGQLGNDFQSNSPGGLPRHRLMQSGELIPLDLSVVVRGYWSDLCRTFCAGNVPTPLQKQAHALILQTLDYVEKNVRPGVSCKQVYSHVAAMLSGHRDWKFPHHLGHGIGLSPHEAPRLNPHWDDTFQQGDVFTAEPGLYAEELRAGIRLERDYVVTATGVQALCSFPLDL
jgi:Xaa-Pro aminopeptidase